MREVVLDTETTGLDPKSGHRIVEIGCVELINHVATEKSYWQYVNPECEMPKAAQAIHGLTTEFLSKKPLFPTIANAFLEFIDNSTLIIHNAEFDMGFINTELKRANLPPLNFERVIDTVELARQNFPGAPVNLDALCKRFRIDNSDRSVHGALKDARLLAYVYLELIGGRQPDFALHEEKIKTGLSRKNRELKIHQPRPHAASPKEILAHERFLKQLSKPIWDP